MASLFFAESFGDNGLRWCGAGTRGRFESPAVADRVVDPAPRSTTMCWAALALDGAERHALLPIPLQAEERDDQRDDGEQRSCDHEVLDKSAVPRGRTQLVPLVESDGQRIPAGILEHDQRQEVVVPDRYEREEQNCHAR